MDCSSGTTFCCKGYRGTCELDHSLSCVGSIRFQAYLAGYFLLLVEVGVIFVRCSPVGVDCQIVFGTPSVAMGYDLCP